MRRCGSGMGNEVLVHGMAVMKGLVVTGPVVTGLVVIGIVAKGATIKGEVMGTGGTVTGVPTVPVEEKFLVIRQKVIEVVPGNVEVPESVGMQGVTGARPI